MKTLVYISPHGLTVPFSPGNNPDCFITEETVQEAIEQLCIGVQTTATPGFTFGRSGSLPTNTWLLADTVPSNNAGRLIFLYNAAILAIYAVNEINAAFSLGTYQHDGLGSTYTLKHTLTFLASEKTKFDILATPVPVTTGLRMGMKITNNNGKNVAAGLIIRGSLTV